MSHEDWLEKIELYLLGALTGSELADVEAHIHAGCEICDIHGREIGEALLLLPRALEPGTPSCRLKNQLMTKLKTP